MGLVTPPPFLTYPVNPQRGRDRRPGEGPPHAIVIHTSEQPRATNDSAEALARFIGGPPTGQEPNLNISSYHWAIDLNSIAHLQKVQDVDGDDWIAFHAPPNWRGEGICLTGRAARDWIGTSDGVDDWPELELAAWLTAWRCEVRGFPARRLTPQQLRNGEPGICGHVDMSNAFGMSDHTDPGVSFPWAWFIQRVKGYLTPPPPPPPPPPPDPDQEDDMTTFVLATTDGSQPEVLYTQGPTGAFYVALEDPASRDQVLVAAKAGRALVTPSQYGRFIHAAKGDIEQ